MQEIQLEEENKRLTYILVFSLMHKLFRVRFMCYSHIWITVIMKIPNRCDALTTTIFGCLFLILLFFFLE